MFSYIQRKEPYVSWKDNTFKLATVPTWSRPIQSNSVQLGITLRALPLKHWRKQLMPEPNSGSGISSIRNQDTPMSNSISNNIYTNLNTALSKGIVVPSLGNNNSSCNDSCNPEKNVIKSSMASINDNYYDSSTSYMEGRCMLYRQKLSTLPIEGIQYINNSTGDVIWPSDDPTGTQNRTSIRCLNERCSSNVVIYKPNNNQFANQGAVDSSSRVSRLKYNTIYENGGSFSTAWGAYYANSGKSILNNNDCKNI